MVVREERKSLMIDMERFTPSSKERGDGMICKSAVTCGICQSPADRYAHMFQCSKHPGHVGDLVVGIFIDLTHEGVT